jgi:hypothetical protein
MALAAAAGPETTGSAEGEAAGAGATQKKHPLVVLKQTRIDGRVFFLPEEGEGDAEPSAKLDVAVYERDGGKALHKTATSDDGRFSLPNLDVGIYQLRIGGLTLELNVEGKLDAGKRPIPKTLLIFMPRLLEK